MSKESTILSRHELQVRLYIKTNKILEQKRHNRECFHMKIQCYHIRKYFIMKLFELVYLKFSVQYKIYKNYLAKKHFQV